MNNLKSYNVCFLGKTGYGKSTLTNALFGTNFATNPFYSCTKELYSVSMIQDAPTGYDFITVWDTPGIGEFPENDIYQKYYNHVASIADVIVLVVTFARTDAPEQELLLSLKDHIDSSKNIKFVVAINHIDSTTVAMTPSYKPWDDESDKPSLECEQYIKERIDIIHEKYDKLFMPSIVVPVCGMKNYGIQALKKELITI